MDKKSFDVVLDEVRKAVLTDYKLKAIEQVHGYFSSEQVVELLKYFSWAEPQLKAMKALQHKMVAVPTDKVVNVLNCFTFSKDKLVALELLALNILDSSNYRPIEDLFKTNLAERKRCRKILDQASKVGCKAPHAMISSCGMIPGNPYPKGKPSHTIGIFPGTPGKKEGDDYTNEGKGIAARILGPSKPAPATYNPHRPVPYPIPPCRSHATIAPSAYNNAGLVPLANVIAPGIPPPTQYLASQGGPENEDSVNQAKPPDFQAKSSQNQGDFQTQTPHNQGDFQAKPAQNQAFPASSNQLFTPPAPNSSAPPTPAATPVPNPSPAKPMSHPSTPAAVPGMNLSTPLPPAFPGQASPAVPSPKRSTPTPSVIRSRPSSALPPAAVNSAPSTPRPAHFSGLSSAPPTPRGAATPCPAIVQNEAFSSVSSPFPSFPYSSTTSTASVSTNPMSSIFSGLPLPLSPALQGLSNSALAELAGASVLGGHGQTGLGNPLLSVLKGFLTSNDASILNSSGLPSPLPAGVPPFSAASHQRSDSPGSFANKCYNATSTPQRTSTPGMPVFPGHSSLSASTPPKVPAQSPAVTPSPASVQGRCNSVGPRFHSTATPHSEHIMSSTTAVSGKPVPIKTEPPSPTPSAFKGPSRSATPSRGALDLSTVLGHVFPPGAAMPGSLSNAMNPGYAGLASFGATLNNATLSSLALAQHSSSTVPTGFSSLPPYTSLSPNTTFASSHIFTSSAGLAGSLFSDPTTVVSATPSSHSTSAHSIFTGMPVSVHNASASPFPMNLSTAVPSLYSVTPGHLASSNPSFPGFPGSNTPPTNAGAPTFPGMQAPSTVAAVAPLPASSSCPSAASVLPGFASTFSSNFNSALVAQANLSSGLPAEGNAAFPGLLSLSGLPGFSPNHSPSTLQGLQQSAAAAVAAQSAFLQAHSAAAVLENFPVQADGLVNYAASPAAAFSLQAGLAQRGWQ
ncbi:proline and serine-rich protein 1 isoform X1 [Ambystoma mexicanum]|uniref:proline and serine-rich protein 1 isoform X1 n=1 Tax=Ambystoma mexicanum TaxID=8296 RepID=UPI0037E8A945